MSRTRVSLNYKAHQLGSPKMILLLGLYKLDEFTAGLIKVEFSFFSSDFGKRFAFSDIYKILLNFCCC